MKWSEELSLFSKTFLFNRTVAVYSYRKHMKVCKLFINDSFENEKKIGREAAAQLYSESSCLERLKTIEWAAQLEWRWWLMINCISHRSKANAAVIMSSFDCSSVDMTYKLFA